MAPLVLINPQADPSDLWRNLWALEKRIKRLEDALARRDVPVHGQPEQA